MRCLCLTILSIFFMCSAYIAHVTFTNPADITAPLLGIVSILFAGCVAIRS